MVGFWLKRQMDYNHYILRVQSIVNGTKSFASKLLVRVRLKWALVMIPLTTYAISLIIDPKTY